MNERALLDACTRRRGCDADLHLSDCPSRSPLTEYVGASRGLFDRLGLWLCRRGLHALVEPGNCPRCGYRYHGGHVGEYARWQAERAARPA